jgi:hypothetical protein
MIVSLTRSDLRDEFCMADEAFALSPISARAALPSEEDYDAISEAFMETSRGRWFLGEYAKRNRNADTRMVLDAVARIEQSLAAQKPPEPEPVVDNGLADAIEAIKAALQQARAAASSAIDGLALEDHLAPVRKGTRIIHEISWRWREIGADSRICDLIDQQVAAIEASCAELSTVDPRAGLSDAFDLIARQIATFDDSGIAEPETGAAAEAVAEAAPPAAEAPIASAEPDAAATHEAEVGSPQAPAVELAVATTEIAAAEVAGGAEVASAAVSDQAPQPAETATAIETEPLIAADVTDAVGISDEDADAHDDAMLDLIAAEMSAPDVSDAHLAFDEDEMPAEAPAAEPARVAPTEAVAPIEPVAIAPAEPVAVAPVTAAVVESAATATLRATAVHTTATVHAEPPQQREAEPSIGSALIADGLLRRQPANDSLAALRRLSQAEKIALFS